MSLVVANQAVAVTASGSQVSLAANPIAALIQAESKSLQSLERTHQNFDAHDEAMQKALKSAVDREAQLKKQLEDLSSHLRNQVAVHAANIAANSSLIANQITTISQMKTTNETLLNQLRSIQTASVNLSIANEAIRVILASRNVPAPC